MRVLLLAYHFPPIGGAGVQRSVGFCRRLPALGVDTVVVCGPGSADGRWTPQDSGLGDTLDPGRVFRSTTPEPSRGGYRRRAVRAGVAPDPWRRWWMSSCLEAGRRAIAEYRPDVILATMSPFESAPAAALLAADSGIPWVADLRDPWALDEMIVYPTAVHRSLARRTMRNCLRSAATVVMNTPRAARAVAAAFPELRDIRVVTNGYEPSDFARPIRPRDDRAFRIVHAGYLHTELGLTHASRRFGWRGGERVAVDILTRSHVYLLDAIATLEPKEQRGLELHLAGLMSRADQARIDDSPVRDLVHVHGYVPHDETIDLMRSADLLFLPMHDLPPGEEALIVPGKTYEYIATGRPILAAVPDGDAADLLMRVGTGIICRPRDVAGLRSGIRRARAGDVPAADLEVVRRYGRDTTAQVMADVLSAAVARR